VQLAENSKAADKRGTDADPTTNKLRSKRRTRRNTMTMSRIDDDRCGGKQGRLAIAVRDAASAKNTAPKPLI